jgi:uncharacterized protein
MTMSDRKFHLHDPKQGSALAIRIVPHAKKNEISEVLDDGTVKIRLATSAVDGKANEDLVQFLAQILDVTPARIEIVAGETGKNKLVTIMDMATDLVQERINSQIK